MSESALARLTASLADRYRIERELGAGGMATVYLAHDLRHDRPVALKLLKPELAAVIGGARFLSEIKTTANLQHPHILPLHDSGEVDGTVFYVMPFVDGESLRDRLSREKQLPIDDAVRIATEVADALHYAHGHGVIHRDIKPENILLHGGHALVADFGIALAASATAGTRMTETGMSLGTPTYMSPEQAMGERMLDARTDVYALGCVLYEMLTGDPPFTGSTAQAIVAKVLTSEPEPLATLRRTVPAHVEQAVRAALQKLPADRPASAAQFAARLANATVAPQQGAGRPAPLARARHAPLLLAAALLVATLAALWGWLRPHAAAPVLRYEAADDEGKVRCPGGSVNGVALSPDGRRVVSCVLEKDGTHLWLRLRDEAKGAPIAGTEGVANAAFSPDGDRVAFISESRLRIAGFNGAPPVTIADSGIGGDGLSWGRDGYLYIDGLTGNGVTGLTRLRGDGSGRENITTVDTARGETDHVYPEPLPNGRGVLFTIRKKSGPPVVAVLDLKSRTTKVLLAGANARFVAPKFLLYTADSKTLVAVPFDAGKMAVTGPGVFIADVTPSVLNAADVAIAASGSLIYLSGGGPLETGHPVWVDMMGRASLVDSLLPESVGGMALSPDGASLAVQMTSDAFTGERLFVKSMKGGALTPLPTSGARSTQPRWSADGTAIYYLSDPRNMGGVGELWRIQSNGSGAPVRADAGDNLFSFDLSGEWIVAARSLDAQLTRSAVVARRIARDTTMAVLFASSAAAGLPTVSPDGRWLAFVSLESGQPEWNVRPFPNASAGKWALTAGLGASAALWSRDGKTFYYIDRDQKVVAISLQLGVAVQVTGRKVLFDAAPFSLLTQRSWDLSRDGSRFLMLRRPDGHARIRTFVIENLPDLLEREARKTGNAP